jgi:hypothetical protein
MAEDIRRRRLMPPPCVEVRAQRAPFGVAIVVHEFAMCCLATST